MAYVIAELAAGRQRLGEFVQSAWPFSFTIEMELVGSRILVEVLLLEGALQVCASSRPLRGRPQMWADGRHTPPVLLELAFPERTHAQAWVEAAQTDDGWHIIPEFTGELVREDCAASCVMRDQAPA